MSEPHWNPPTPLSFTWWDNQFLFLFMQVISDELTPHVIPQKQSATGKKMQDKNKRHEEKTVTSFWQGITMLAQDNIILAYTV